MCERVPEVQKLLERTIKSRVIFPNGKYWKNFQKFSSLEDDKEIQLASSN